MENFKLNGLFPIANDCVIIHNSTISEIVNYINAQTAAINKLTETVAELESSIEATDNAVKTNSNNIKTIAQALEGVYNHET